MEALQTLNTSLKTRGIRGRVLAVKDRLFLRGTFTTADGDKKDRKIPLGLPANQGQLLEAECRVIALAKAMQSTGFVPSVMPWEAEKIQIQAETKRKQLTVSESVSELEAEFWKGKIRTSAAERTWDRLKAEADRLPQAATITMDLLVATASETRAGSRTRLESCKVLKRLAKLIGLDELDRLDELRTPYEPSVREIPEDDHLADFLSSLDPEDPWAWATWALATYGCRPSEVFSLQPETNGTAQVLTIKQKGESPKWRTTMALPVPTINCDIEAHQRSVPWQVDSPSEYESATAKLHTDRWAKWLRRQDETIKLYSLRHAWAIRSIRKNLNASLAAKCMGHDVATHHREYHRWLDQADIAAVAAQIQAA